MRRVIVALCSAVLSATVLGARQQQQPPVFRGGVELVTLDVTVVDKSGKPVKGLTASDFTVTLDGQQRAVRALDFLEFGAASGSDAVARQTTNAQAATAKRGGRVFLIVFDDLSCRPLQARGLIASAERMLATLDPDDLVGLVTTSALGPLVQPTRDRHVLAAALHSKTLIGRYDDNPSPRFTILLNEALDIFSGTPPGTLAKVVERECGIQNYNPLTKTGPGNASDSMCPNLVEADGRHLGELTMHRTAMQMAAYRMTIDALRAAPKPRVLIALSSGVATDPNFDLKEQTDLISRAAAEAGVQFYGLTELPDLTDLSRPAVGPLLALDEGRYLNGGLQTVASAAGGEAFLVSGQADRFFTRIERETSGFYQLGVEAPVSPDKHRVLNAKVTVRMPDVTVRANPHALVESVAAEAVPIDERLKTALAQGGMSFGVPVALATSLRRDPAPNSALQLGVDIQVPALVLAPLTAMFALVSDDGRIVEQGRKQVPPGKPGEDYQLALPVPLEPGNYRLRVVVADASGNVGGVEHRVIATLPHFGRCSVSELFTTWATADSPPRFLALETLPDTASVLRTSIELYPDDPSAASTLVVRLALLPAGARQPIVERDATPTGTGATRVVIASLPVSQLAPGVYTIRATILEAGAVTGTVSTTIRKKGPAGIEFSAPRSARACPIAFQD